MDEQTREPAIVRFNASIGDEQDPVERLRFFCSIAMNGQDWIDVEPLFDALAALSQPAVQGGNAASGLSDWQLRDMGIDPSKRHNQGSVWPFPKPKVTP